MLYGLFLAPLTNICRFGYFGDGFNKGIVKMRFEGFQNIFIVKPKIKCMLNLKRLLHGSPRGGYLMCQRKLHINAHAQAVAVSHFLRITLKNKHIPQAISAINAIVFIPPPFCG
jgi:hypothetical protein